MGRNDVVRGIATRERDYAQQAINNVTQQDIAGILEGIYDTMQDQVPEIFRQYRFPITDSDRCLDSSIIPTMPWMAFTLCNDGPGGIYVFVNDKVDIVEHKDCSSQASNVAPLRKGEKITFNMKNSKIHRVYLQCGTGENASVRIYSEGKQWSRIRGVCCYP